MEVDSANVSNPFAGQWSHLQNILTRKGPLAHADFVPGNEGFEFVRKTCRVLCVGAGGLGCELLKNLALMGFSKIDVIDMDTIELSNLNRQFLFRMDDVGKSKAEIAARFVNNRIKTCNIEPHFKKVQDMDESFYSQFHIIVLGLDSLEARRWMNSMVCNLVQIDAEGNVCGGVIPMIDGGTEGFKGHARVIIPGVTANFEDTLDLFPPQTTYPLCTLASTPRTPAHCIVWAKELHWPEVSPFGKNVEFDGDNAEHMQWVFEKALQRANAFGIEGVTLSKTQGVAKNIIPAIASTNAVIAAACAQECFKIATSCAGLLSDFMMYMGGQGIYTHTFQAEKKETCPWFGSKVLTMNCTGDMTLNDLMEKFKEHPELQLKTPDVRAAGKTLYMRIISATHANLEKKLKDLVTSNTELAVTDPAALVGRSRRVILKFD
eukprot:c20973_g1_i1.p1 GENE.c20973_g1_i1~~c20973_g1_i1.p1  ORF type:complete len:434 (-),score=192.43 c20973_g1_i1:60-1361(-)